MAQGKTLGTHEGEWSTESIIELLDGTLYYRHENGGARGSWDRQDGDGVWRERPVAPTREITRREANCLLMDWGYDPYDGGRT